MPAPSASTIARQAANHTLFLQPETAVVQRVTRTPNDSGGSTAGEPIVVATVKARLKDGVGRGLEAYTGRLEGIDLWTLTFPSGTDVQTGDVVTINGRGFYVQGPDGAESFEMTRRVIATETA